MPAAWHQSLLDQEAIDVLAVLNALRASLTPRVLSDQTSDRDVDY